jgi:Reverse transcriptase (RNA-dependent DNA polymerase)
MESLIFLVEKRDGRVKARACANGSSQREYISKEDAASPTAATESILLTATIDAKENRDIMTADIPNAFVQTDMTSEGNEKMVMKIRGPLVDMLVSLDPALYQPFVVAENKDKILYVQLLKALYGTLQAALLFYKKLRKDLESVGFKVNPYDPCVANRIVGGKQQTVTWHVDDLKSSHEDAKVNDDFLKWLEEMYGDPNVAPVKATRGKVHEYLAMKLDFTTPGKVKVNMTDYVGSMIKEFPEEVTTSSYPWNDNLFKVDDKDPKLTKAKQELFHTFVAKGLFLCKRGRPDIQPAIAFLSTRVKAPGEQDWFKLSKLMGFLKTTRDDVLTLSSDDTHNIVWHVDAAFGVHNDMRSHTGATMSLGEGAVQSISTKQKVNTRSSTEAELVSIDDVISKIIWTKLFLEEQGFKVNDNILKQDNLSSMKLDLNGKSSSGKRTRHFNIKYFHITDLINRKEASIEYCPTEEMIGDYLSKPTTGAKFHKFCNYIMNLG